MLWYEVPDRELDPPDSVIVYTCSVCGGEIYEGEEYYDSAKGPICIDCMEGMSVQEILELVGDQLEVA